MLHDDARTTTKETTIHNAIVTNVKGNDATYYGIDDSARTTTKETVAVKDVYRNIGGTVYRVISYDPELVAKTTTKETTLHTTEGFIGGILEGIFGGYLSSNPEAKNTNKQFTHTDYSGTIVTDVKQPTSHIATENAEIDSTREIMMIAAGHTPNGGQSGLKKIHNAELNMKTNKIPEESLATRTQHNPTTVYQKIPNVNACGATKEKDILNAQKDRLDPNSGLESLDNNPLNININKHN